MARSGAVEVTEFHLRELVRDLRQGADHTFNLLQIAYFGGGHGPTAQALATNFRDMMRTLQIAEELQRILKENTD